MSQLLLFVFDCENDDANKNMFYGYYMYSCLNCIKSYVYHSAGKFRAHLLTRLSCLGLNSTIYFLVFQTRVI